MNICFISNFSKTYLFAAVGKELRRYGIESFWIATNRKLHSYLEREFGREKVLLINRKNILQNQPPLGEYKINELIFGDRVWRHHPREGTQFLQNIQRPVYDFLSKNDIRKVFGEITWAHEILIHRMCGAQRELNCQFLNPHVVRIPNNRFGFFTDERQSKLLELPGEIDTNWKKLVPKEPNYLSINKGILRKQRSTKGRIQRLKRFITNENIDPLDPALLVDNPTRIRQCIREEWQREQFKTVETSSFNLESCRPYVFIGLHKQPEASVDVFGRYYENQLENIQNLWRALPSGWTLVVKEHSIAIGDRSKDFYKAIQSLPNVVLVNEHIPSYDIIKRAELVATVTGTPAYEAALMGIPAITLAPVFFNGLNRCRQVTLEDFDTFHLGEISKRLRQEPENITAFSKFIYNNTFEGNVLDPVSDPGVLKEENIRKIARVIKKALQLSVRTFQYELVC